MFLYRKKLVEYGYVEQFFFNLSTILFANYFKYNLNTDWNMIMNRACGNACLSFLIAAVQADEREGLHFLVHKS